MKKVYRIFNSLETTFDTGLEIQDYSIFWNLKGYVVASIMLQRNLNNKLKPKLIFLKENNFYGLYTWDHSYIEYFLFPSKNSK